ncbi:MAG TPA: CDP-diacylglycerol--serine O-phosphatidyltransferase [Phaeodactylibacter sp.]|nr:CDP-diacylglycerol--serine O-phosphatidyltransferase [Phaeodactylibacter sp.]
MRKHIPNAITLLNALLGSVALVALFAERHQIAMLLFLAAGLMDFGDGLAARLLRAKSPVGKELDSLADMISFGLLPSTALYLLLQAGLGAKDPLDWRSLPAFLLAASAALRLARFNLDERQTQDFIGLPTPATALFFMGLLLVWSRDSMGLGSFVSQPALLYACLCVFALLQLAPLPLFSMKFQGPGWKGNAFRYIFALTSLGLLLWLGAVAIPLSILWYLALGLIKNFAK